MSYSLLGTSCTSKTIACTSNHKFLPLHSSEYLKHTTYMLQYPGNSASTVISNSLPKSDDKDPEVIKSYYGKIYDENGHKNIRQSEPNLACKTCKSV